MLSSESTEIVLITENYLEKSALSSLRKTNEVRKETMKNLRFWSIIYPKR